MLNEIHNVTYCVLVDVVIVRYQLLHTNPVDGRKSPPQSTSSSSDSEDDIVEGTVCSNAIKA